MSAKFQPTSTNLFLLFSRDKLVNQYWPRLRKCVESLTDEQIWWRPNPSSNSIGNLVLHLNGNVRQWLVDSFNKKEDQRDRPAEFAAAGEISGSNPDPEVVTMSAGTGVPGFSCCSFATSCFTRSTSCLFVGPKFDPPDDVGSYPFPAAEGRG